MCINIEVSIITTLNVIKESINQSLKHVIGVQEKEKLLIKLLRKGNIKDDRKKKNKKKKIKESKPSINSSLSKIMFGNNMLITTRKKVLSQYHNQFYQRKKPNKNFVSNFRKCTKRKKDV